MPGLTILGNPSKTVYLKRELDRLAEEFVAAVDIKKGQPVMLNTNGTIKIWDKANADTWIGNAYGDCVTGDFCTVFTRGWAVVYGIAKTGGVNAGLAIYDAYDTSTSVNKPGSGTDNSTGYSVYANGTTIVQGWILDQVAAGLLCRILLKN